MAGENRNAIPKKMKQIVATGEELFMRHGIKRVTIEEICAKAQVSKMTYYKYFENKIELVKYIFNRWFDEFQERAEEVLAVRKPFTEELGFLFQWKLDLVAKMSPEFIEEFLHLDPELTEFMIAYNQRSYELFRDLLIDWQRCGDIRQELKPEFIMAVLDKIQELYHDDNLRKLYDSDIDFIREAHNVLFFGVVPRPDADRPQTGS
jgi:AcrR family transcriptional regulator